MISLSMIISIGICSFPVFAQNFLKTASDQFLAPGEFNIGVKNTYLRNAMAYDFSTQADTLVAGPTLEFQLGLSEKAEFETQWDMIRFMKTEDSSTHDISDVSFFTNLNFIPENIFPSFGIRLGTKLPNASDETHVGTDLTDAFIWAVSGKQFGAFHTFSNLGVEIIGNPKGGQDDALSYGLGSVVPLSQNLKWAMEISGRYFQPDHPINQSSLRMGFDLTLKTLNAWQVDFGVSTGLISQSESWGAQVGVRRLFHVF